MSLNKAGQAQKESQMPTLYRSTLLTEIFEAWAAFLNFDRKELN